MEFKLPELGENVEFATVSGVIVSAGDRIEKDQPVVELETDKAVFEVPSDVAGVVKEILVKVGDEVKVGQAILEMDAAEEPARPAGKPEAAIEPERAPPLPSPAPAARRPQARGNLAPAAPSVRRFAREIGIDINEVPGTGPAGRISLEDVKRYSKALNEGRRPAAPILPGFQVEPLPDFAKWGETERKPMGKVRQKTAEHLTYAWLSAPRVTQFDRADITEAEKLRKGHKSKLTITAILVKIAAEALKEFPQFNAAVDMTAKEIVYRRYFHIGVAVETDRGLLVPVLRDADKKNIIEIAAELTRLAEKARTRKITLEEMQGAGFTISNLGGIGGTAFTPIVNAPEVAILGVARSRIEAVYIDGRFQPRPIVTLGLSYDHRLIDGADGARFLRRVVEAIERPDDDLFRT